MHELRGAGLMIEAKLRDAAGQPVAAAGMAAVRQACTEAGLLITSTNNTIVLVPPLILSAAQGDELVERLDTALHQVPDSAIPAGARTGVGAGVSAG